MSARNQSRTSTRSTGIGGSLAGAAVAALSLAGPAAAQVVRVDAHPSVRVERPADPGLDSTAPVLSCLSVRDEYFEEAGVTRVFIEVRNTCASLVRVDAGVDLLLRDATGARFVVVDSDHLVGRAPVVLETTYAGPPKTLRSCVRLQGTWRPADGVQPARTLADERCP